MHIIVHSGGARTAQNRAVLIVFHRVLHILSYKIIGTIGTLFILVLKRKPVMEYFDIITPIHVSRRILTKLHLSQFRVFYSLQ